MEMYNFNNGAVVLGIRDGKYYITRDGDEQYRPWNEEQASNAMLAINDFTAAIHDHLRTRAKVYLREHNGNPITGCNVAGVKCYECDCRGAKGTMCMDDTQRRKK